MQFILKFDDYQADEKGQEREILAPLIVRARRKIIY